MLVKRTFKWLMSILLIAILYAYAMFQGGFVSWFLFYSVVPLVVYAFLIGLFPLRSLKVKRIFPVETKQAGDTLLVTIEVKKPLFPLFYLIVNDQLPKKMKQQMPNQTVGKALFFPLFKRKLTYTYALSSLPRGEHQFQHVIVKTGDLFGFIHKQVEHSVEQSLIVYPKVERINWQPMKRGSSNRTAFAQQRQHDVSSIVGIRDYIPGDRMSWIDWKSTAKRNQVVTKQFEERILEHILLFLDDSKQNDTSDPELFEKAVTMTASLIATFERKGYPFVMPVYASENREQHRSARHHYYSILAKVERDRDEAFADVVKRYFLRFQKSNRLIFVLTNVTHEFLQLIRVLVKQNFEVECVYVMRPQDELVRELKAIGAIVHAVIVESTGDVHESR